jgi:hypothetical protein
MNSSLGPDIPIGCGLHADRLDNLYRTTYPLFAYLKPWGGEFVVVIQDGHGIQRQAALISIVVLIVSNAIKT